MLFNNLNQKIFLFTKGFTVKTIIASFLALIGSKLYEMKTSLYGT